MNNLQINMINESDVKYSHVVDKLLYSITAVLMKIEKSNDDTKVKIFDICATMGMEYIKWTAGEKNLDITMKYYEQRIAILHNNYFNKDIIVDISPKNKSTQ